MRAFTLSMICTVLCALMPTSASSAPTISAIKVEGNVRSDRQAILRIMRTKANSALERSTLSEDIKRIYQLGFYADIQMVLRQEDGQQFLVVQVVEKPSIRKMQIIKKDKERGGCTTNLATTK